MKIALHWMIQRAWFRDHYQVFSIDDCQCAAEEVFFGFTLPASHEVPAQMSLFEDLKAA